jgi:hypothetical protein
MYVITASFVRNRREWLEFNLGGVRMSDILTLFEDVHITVMYNSQSVNWRPMYSALHDLMYKTPFTLTEWMAHVNQNNINLDTTSTPFTFDILKKISAQGAREVGFSVSKANAYINPNSTANSIGEDLLLRRGNTDYSKFVGNILTSVNGIIHPVVINQHGIYVRNAIKTIMDSGVRDINMINFESIGGFKVENFPYSNMYKQDGGSVKLYNNCCFNMNYDVTGTVFGAIIDGYLHLLDDVIEIIGQRSIRIDWGKVPLLKRAIVANGSPPNKTAIRSVRKVSESMVTSDEWIEDIIMSPFSYLLVFKRQDITKSSKEIVSKGIPGVYFSPEDISGPLFTGVGENYSYKKSRDFSTYEIAQDQHTLINLPVGGHYPSSFDTRLGGNTQYGTSGTFTGGQGLLMGVVKEVQFHVLPRDF